MISAILPRVGAPPGVGRHQPFVRPFEWGVDWLADHRHSRREAIPQVLQDWGERPSRAATSSTPSRPPTTTRSSRRPHVHERDRHAASGEQHGARALLSRSLAARPQARRPRAWPQWNSDAEGHVGLCRLLNRFGISALRLSLPYHDVAHAARAHARRLHRQRQRRADGAGLPPGGARRAARHRLAATRRATSRSGSSAPASARVWRC